MASYQVLAAPQNIGFLTGLGRGIDESAGKYADAMSKRKEAALLADQKQGNMNKFSDAMKQGGFDISGASMNADGTPSYSFKPKTVPETAAKLFSKDPIKAMRQAVMSPQAAASLGPELGVTQPPEPMMTEGLAPNLKALLSPRQDQMFSQTESYATPEEKQGKYAEAVKSKIAETMAPGLPQDKGIRELFNVPQETAQEKTATPEEFANDIQSLVDQSGDDQQAFIQSLAELAPKYTNNPAAVAKIQKLIQLNKTSMPKKTAEDAYLDKLKF
jgi:hypothetical protein